MSSTWSLNMDDSNNDWSTRQENLLRGWADKARCYSWMHTESSKFYRKMNYSFTIPCILLSTVTGSANFMVSGTEGGGGDYYTTITLGCMNLFTAMLMSTNQFLKLPEYTDRHKTAANGYSKFLRNVKTQLALDVQDREPGVQFVSMCQKEFDTLTEQSPYIPDTIIVQFKMEFKDATIQMPDIITMSESPKEHTTGQVSVEI